MTESGAADRHLNELLNALAPGGFHNGIAPSGTESPYIVAVTLDSEDVANGMASAGATEFVRRVFAVDEAGDYPESVADAIYGALEQATTTQGDWTVYSRRIRPYDFADTDSGRQFRQEGGDYMILVRDLN